MVWYVLLIGIVNLSLGFAAAAFWDHFQDLLAVSDELEGLREQPEVTEPLADSPQQEPTEEEQPAVPETSETPTKFAGEIPDEWREMLTGVTKPATFLDAAIVVFGLEILRYRDDLIAVESKCHDHVSSENSEAIGNCKAAVGDVLDSCQKRHVDLLRHLVDRNVDIGPLAEVPGQLEVALSDFSVRIEAARAKIEHLDTQAAGGGERLITQIGALIDETHQIRDTIQELLLRAIHIDGRISAIDKSEQVDALTGWYNRVALEKIFDDWWQDDPYRLRTVSVAMIDIDRFGNVNQSYGTATGDLLLSAFTKVVDGTMRKQRNYDVATRYTGQQFAIFFGDTGAPAAINAVERMRQTVEAAVFEYGERQFQVTFTAGVAEVQQDDTSTTVLERAVQTMRSAKEAGRNCTYLNEKGDPAPVPVENLEISEQVCQLAGGT